MAWLVLTAHQTQAEKKMLTRTRAPTGGCQEIRGNLAVARVPGAGAPGAPWAGPGQRAYLPGGKLLRGDGAGRAVLVGVLHLGPQSPRLVLLAL